MEYLRQRLLKKLLKITGVNNQPIGTQWLILANNENKKS
jgi:hypothetical protein